MLRSILTLFCLLKVAFAISDFQDLYLRPNIHDEDPSVSEKPKFCVPVYYSGRSLEEATQNRLKRSLEELPESWPLVRVNREHDIVKTIHLPSSFIPRLGRGRRVVTDHVINLSAGTAFTPRLGRRAETLN